MVTKVKFGADTEPRRRKKREKKLDFSRQKIDKSNFISEPIASFGGEITPDLNCRNPDFDSRTLDFEAGSNEFLHEYHEISDAETCDSNKKTSDNNEQLKRFRKSSFDLGPSLMDEVFRALGDTSLNEESTPSKDENLILPPTPTDTDTNVKNEMTELTSIFCDPVKGNNGVVKPISATEERTLDSAIAMANQLASKSMPKLDLSQPGTEVTLELKNCESSSPHTPSKSATGRFNFKFPSRSSPKVERRHYSVEAAAIPDIQSSITEQAKEVYNSLIENGKTAEKNSSSEDNPLKMLRNSNTVRPKIRGNKHNNLLGLDRERKISDGTTSLERFRRYSSEKCNGIEKCNGVAKEVKCSGVEKCNEIRARIIEAKLKRNSKDKNCNNEVNEFENCQKGANSFENSLKTKNNLENSHKTLPSSQSLLNCQEERSTNDNSNNPIPLPPRDRSKSTGTSPIKVRHQRKYPLLIPSASSLLKSIPDENKSQIISSPRIQIQHTHNPILAGMKSGNKETLVNEILFEEASLENVAGPAKPPRIFQSSDDVKLRESHSDIRIRDDRMTKSDCFSGPFSTEFRDRLQSEDFVDGAKNSVVDSEKKEINRLEDGSLGRTSNHVSCEDLLEFALDKPNSNRTKGRCHGVNSDEVKLLLKVLKKRISEEDCLESLDICDWDVHKALKILKLRLLTNASHSYTRDKETLESFSWDVSKAGMFLLGVQGDNTRL